MVVEQPTTLLFELFPDSVNQFFEVLAYPIFNEEIQKWIPLGLGWSPIHFIIPFLLFYIIWKMTNDGDKTVIITVAIIIIFEILEFVISYPWIVILREEFADTFFDLVIGFISIFIARAIFVRGDG